MEPPESTPCFSELAVMPAIINSLTFILNPKTSFLIKEKSNTAVLRR